MPIPSPGLSCDGIAGGPALRASELAFARGGRPVFDGIDFGVGPGGLVQVMGPNGSGKSSLLRVLSGLLQPSGGSVSWLGRAVRAGDPAYLQSLAYLGHADGIDTDLTAGEHLRYAARLAGLQQSDEAVRAALSRLGIGKAMHVPVRTLSQGQRRRVALARLARVRRALWLLDEPLTSVDDESAARFHDLLGEHLRDGGMAVIATHRLLPGGGEVLQIGGAQALAPV
ncbi:cytochrome c biogenesis heme-transporting ATPase CcmA [Cupriavidus numazuensis]|uniref:Cytochrome c biogenesis ATP-binding export protein CcmA n=1 Tax=Cupriavidus numazuensis TaxID=221992 RepID=A0ABM8THR5_9BURK|nr:Cytochrome c biogenesis ATP-binding export protein CcmA [Cupriavidus numazuensis]